jgi:hypothetical protein
MLPESLLNGPASTANSGAGGEPRYHGDALLVNVNRFAFTTSSFCNFLLEMENAFLRHGVRRHGISRKL